MSERPSPAKRRRRASSAAPGKGKQPLKNEPDAAMSDSTEDAKWQKGTLYDAVAGRLGYDGFLNNHHTKPAPPDQVLFRSKGAPERFEENDTYFAHRNLPPGVRLPDSDLLKAIHAYASDFYGSGYLGNTNIDFRSLDETALLAMGILLEEAAAHILGKTGDLAFVEGEEVERKPKT